MLRGNSSTPRLKGVIFHLWTLFYIINQDSKTQRRARTYWLQPFKVVEQEEEGDQIRFRQRQQQVEHTALFGHTVRESCRRQRAVNISWAHETWQHPPHETRCRHWPMAPAKFGYSSSVKRGSGSSRKYSFSVPAMAFTSISLISMDTSLLSTGGNVQFPSFFFLT